MKTTYRNNFLTETYALQKHSFFLIGVMHCKLNALPVMIIIFFSIEIFGCFVYCHATNFDRHGTIKETQNLLFLLVI